MDGINIGKPSMVKRLWRVMIGCSCNQLLAGWRIQKRI